MAPKYHLLIVDDEKNAREGLKWALEGKEYTVDLAATGDQALDAIEGDHVDLVVTDLKMPGMSGLELLDKVKSADPSTEVIVITAHSTIETAVEAMKKGAFDYLTKPVRLDELRLLIERALQRQTLTRENERLLKAVEDRYGFENIVGRSAGMEQVFQIVRQVAPTRATALIEGESGTGKELIANAIHFNSPRRRHAFVPVNCGALAAGLLESELFGHEKGAFTNAIRAKAGRFELANNGTLFLDEISETSPDFQVRLLRVLQEQRFERVGGTETISVDVRIIAATNRNLEELVAQGKFREDLFYRLNVITIKLPALRERAEDIPLLANHFLKEFSEQYDKAGIRFSAKVLAAFQSYAWPGNVRQLRNVIENMVVLSNSKELTPRNLPDQLKTGTVLRGNLAVPLGAKMADVEREVIRATLAHFEGNRAEAARQLDLSRKTLYRKMQEYGLE